MKHSVKSVHLATLNLACAIKRQSNWLPHAADSVFYALSVTDWDRCCIFQDLQDLAREGDILNFDSAENEKAIEKLERFMLHQG
jgi:hypothetical protein